MLHNKAPPAVVEKIELSQLLITVTTGVAGVALGAATPEPEGLEQPSTDWVTE